MRVALPLSAIVAASLAITACGSDDSPAGERGIVRDGGHEHVHGVGIDPHDESVLLATHTGLFRSPRGSLRAERVGDRRQDTMGFTVVGPRRYLGSGHPDLRDGGPPMLGLIRSHDGGRSWQPVSLSGAADLHVLRASGRRVFAYDSSAGRLLASDDAGRTWTLRPTPGPVIDLAIDPRQPDRLVASTQGGPRVSSDGGRSWRALPASAPGLLMWTDALYLVDAQGIVTRTRDLGRSWQSVGTVGGRPAATSTSGDRLVVATEDGRVRMSSDGGRTWQTRVTA